MIPTALLWAALIAAAPPTPATAAEAQPERASQTQAERHSGRIMLGLLPLSFAAFAGIHSFGYGLRQDWIPCTTPRNPQAAFVVETVLCTGLPAKVELVASAAPLTLTTIGTMKLTSVRLEQGRPRWRRRSAIAALATGSVLIAGGFAAVVVSVVAEPPLFREGEGWGWPFWTHILVSQAGAAVMAGGGALVGAGSAHLLAASPRRRSTVSITPTWRRPGVMVSGRF